MRFDSFMVAVLLGIAFLSVGIMIIDEQGETYSRTMTDKTYENVSIFLDNQANVSQDIKGDLKFSDVGEDNAEDSLFTGGFRSIVKQWDYFTAVGEIVSATAKNFGIPPIFVTLVVIILLTVLAWAMIYMVFRFMPRG